MLTKFKHSSSFSIKFPFSSWVFSMCFNFCFVFFFKLGFIISSIALALLEKTSSILGTKLLFVVEALTILIFSTLELLKKLIDISLLFIINFKILNSFILKRRKAISRTH